LKNLTVSSDPNILYTFHMYIPMVFTHQAASWMDNTRRYTKPVAYPVDTAEHADFYQGVIPDNEQGVLDKAFLERVLSPAFEFIARNNRPLYCGEYGVINNAAIEHAIRWCNDVADLLLSHGIGRAVWSYRGFSNITDENNEVPNMDYVKAVSRR